MDLIITDEEKIKAISAETKEQCWKNIESVIKDVHFAVYPDVIQAMKKACLS